MKIKDLHTKEDVEIINKDHVYVQENIIQFVVRIIKLIVIDVIWIVLMFSLLIKGNVDNKYQLIN